MQTNPTISIGNATALQVFPTPVAVSGTLNPGTASVEYQIGAIAGETLSFANTTNYSPPPAGTWDLYGPDNQLIAGTSLGTNFATSGLAADGTYELILAGDNTGGTIPYSFTVTGVTPTPQALDAKFGTVQSGTVPANSSVNINYTVPAGIGLELYYDSQSAANPAVTLVDPNSNQVFSDSNQVDSGPFVPRTAGTYTLTVTNTTGSPAPYRFNLMALSNTLTPVSPDSATALTFGTPVSGSLNPGFSAVVYSFTATAGQQVYLDGQGTSGSVNVSLEDASGNSVFGSITLSGSDQGPITLAKAGTYYVVIDGESSTPATYQFQLVDTSAATALSFASANSTAPISGTLTDGASTALYSFTASAGQQLFIQGGTDSPGFASQVIIYRPDGSLLEGTWTELDQGAQVLTETGTYLVAVQGITSPGTPVSYASTLALSTPSTTTSALTLGTAVGSHTLTVPGESDTYTFHGTAGQQVYFDGLGGAANLQATLEDPRGNPVSGINEIGTNSGWDGAPATLATTGTYSVVINGSGHATGSYNFRLLDTSTATALDFPSANSTVPISGTLANGASVGLYSFTASAGQRLYMQGGTDSPAGDSIVTVYQPDGSAIINQFSEFDEAADLTESGTYVVAVRGQADVNTSVSYSSTLALSTPSTITRTLTIGTPVGAQTLGVPGEVDTYTFTGTAGEQLYFDGLSGLNGIDLTLSAPPNDGTVSALTGLGLSGPGSDDGPATLAESGTYSLAVTGSGHTTGSYNFRLVDVSTATPLTFPSPNSTLPISGMLTDGASVALYSFTGTAGQQLFIQGGTDSPAGGSIVTVYRPDGSAIINQFSEFDQAADLSESGTYLVAVRGQTDINTPVTYSATLALSTPSTTTTTLTLGTAIGSHTLAVPGEADTYTFNGTAGQQVYFDGLTDSTGGSLVARLFNPSGTDLGVIDLSTGQDEGPATLPTTGTYSLVVTGSGHTTGSYNFRLLDLASGTTLTPPTSIPSSTLNPGMSSATYKFSGVAGETLTFINTTSYSSGPAATLALYGPDNEFVERVNLNNNFITPALPADGTYSIIIAGTDPVNPIPYSYNISATLPASATLDGKFGTVQTGTVPANSSMNITYTIPAGTGLELYYDSQSASNPTATLADPNALDLFTLSGSSDFGPFVPTASGTYTLTLNNTSGSSEPYRFNLLALPGDATALTLGTPASGTLSPGYAAAVYSFTGTAGQQIYFDGQGSLGNAGVHIVDADAEPLTGLFIDAGSDSGPFRLTRSGTYYVVIDGESPTPASYQFRVMDTSTATALSFPTANSTAAVSGTLTNGASVALYQFTATAGQRLYFVGGTSSPSSDTEISIYQPDGGALQFSEPVEIGQGPFVLTESGTYVVAVKGQADVNTPVTYSGTLAVSTPSTTTAGLTLGTAVGAHTLAVPGEADTYTFNGTAGQQVYFDGLADSSGGNLFAMLVDPFGNSFAILTTPAQDEGPATLPSTGTYSVVVRGFGTSTGSYNFRLLDLATATALNFPSANSSVPISGTLANGASVALYTFTATAGQQLLIEGGTDSPSNNALVEVYRPDGGFVTDTEAEDDTGVATLTQTGTYLVAFRGQADVNTSVSYSSTLVLSTPSTTTGTLALGTPVSGTLSVAGEADTYRFSGTAGQQVYFDGLSDASGGNILATLRDPFGNGFSSNFFVGAGTDAGPAVLPSTGTYSVTITGSGRTTGSYSFRLLDTSTATALSFPSANSTVPISGTLTNGASTTFYSFTATAGQQLYVVGGTDSPANGASIMVFRPNGSSLGSTLAEQDLGVLDLNETGTYLVAVRGQAAVNTPVSYSATLALSTPSTTAGTLTLGAPVGLHTLSVAGETDTYTFTGTAGQRVFLEGLGGNTDFRATLLTPFGGGVFPIVNASLNVGSNAGPATLPVSGTYTVVITDAGHSTGGYNFALTDLGTQPALNVNTTDANFNVTLSSASAQPVTVWYNTADGTATLAPDGDYRPAVSQLTFAPGQTSQTVTVKINDIVNFEFFSENFFVNLFNPTGATIAQASGTGTILPNAVAVDNSQGSPAFTESGTWTAGSSGLGYDGNFDSLAGTNSPTATGTANWQVTGVPAGTFAVEATWPSFYGPAVNAPYSLIVNGTNVQTDLVNQTVLPSGDSVDDDHGNLISFQTIGYLNLTGGSNTLQVSLGNNAEGTVLADAIRLVPLVTPTVDLSWAASLGNPGALAAGTPFTVNRQYTVSGSATPAATTISYYASSSATFGAGSLYLLGTETIPAGQAAGSYSGNSPALTMPSGGTVYLFAKLATDNAFAETDETNNLTAVGGGTPTALSVSGPIVVDDSAGGPTTFTETGTWVENATVGYNNTSQFSATGTATWQTPGLDAGTYEIDATWNADTNRTPSAVYTVSEGATQLATFTVNQQNAPVGSTSGGWAFQDLGTVTVTNGGDPLRIVLSNNASGAVIADAVRLEPSSTTVDLNWSAGGDGLSGVPASESVGAPFTITRQYTVSGATTPSASTISYYASTSSTFGAAPTFLIGSETIPSGQTPGNYTGTSPSLTLPSAGSYFLFAQLDANSAFTEANETNNVSSASSSIAVSGNYILEVGATGYSETGTWYDIHDGTHYAAPTTNASPTATANWLTPALTAGSYEIDATWSGGSNRAINATYNVFDNATLVGTFTVNQQNSPVGMTASGFTFQDLGTVPVSNPGDTLKIVLGNNASGAVIAGPIRVTSSSTTVDLNWSAVGDGLSGVSASESAGTPFTVTRQYTVTGATTAAPSTINYYASTSPTFGAAPALLVGSETIPSGQAPGNYTATSPSLTLPSAGTYYLFAELDSGSAITETNETNNVSAASSSIAVSGSYILQVGASGYSETGTWFAIPDGTHYAAPTTGASPTSTASWQTPSLTAGSYEIDATWTADSNRAYNVPYSVYEGTTLLGTFTVNQQTAPVGTTAGGFTFQDLGTVTVGITGDPLTIVLGNNASGAVIADAVRVTPSSTVLDLNWSSPGDGLSNVPGGASAGTPFTVTRQYTVTGATTAASSTINYYASTSPTFGAAPALLVGSETIPSGQAPGNYTGTSPSLTLPGAGTYYLFAQLDSGSAVTETNETNNVSSASTAIAVSGSYILQVGAAGYSETGTWFAIPDGTHYAAPTTGASPTSTASWQTPALGAGSYEIDATWTSASNRAYNAPYSVYEGTTLLGTFTVNQQTAPVGTTAGGFTFQDLGTVTVSTPGDALTIVLGNNASGAVIADAVRVTPSTTTVDLNWSAGGDGFSGVPSTASTDTPFTITRQYTVSGSATASSSTINYYASTSPIYGAAPAFLIGSETIASGQAPGNYTGTSPSLTLPSAGTYYIFAQLDSGSAITETNETNNVSSASTAIAVSGTYILVDRAAGYSETGTWNDIVDGTRVAAATANASPTSTATWETGSLAAGTYEVDATWTAEANRATNAPYSVSEGNTLRGTYTVNQSIAPSGGVTAGGYQFQELGTVVVAQAGDALTVVLGNNANGYVIADAIRITRVS